MNVALLVTGGSGRLGKQLKPHFPQGLFPTHEELPVQSWPQVKEYVKENHVETIIHCAALTSVPYCEDHQEEAYYVNVIGTKNLLDTNPRYFILISTACVFPGDNPDKFYSESDIPYPKNFYALTKLLAEQEASHSKCDTLIIRTNFIERGLWPYPKAFTDRYATYLYSDQVAKAIADIIKQRKTGVLHICGDEKLSMLEFARIMDPKVEPMTLSEYGNPPNLTRNMALTSERIPPFPFRCEQ